MNGAYTPFQISKLIDKSQIISTVNQLINLTYSNSAQALLEMVDENLVQLPGGKDWMEGSYMKKPEEEIKLHLRPRATQTVSIEIPTDTLDSLKKVAVSRNMPFEALLKLYIGQGLRQDLAKLFSERVLETTAQVLARYIQSEAEISTIIQEIHAETAR